MDINLIINQLLAYGVDKQLIDIDDFDYLANRLIAFFNLKEFKKIEIENHDLLNCLEQAYDYAVKNGLIGSNMYEREIFISSLMDIMLKRPSEIQKKFEELYHIDPISATTYFYNLSHYNYYIQYDKIAKNKSWKYQCEYGNIDITVNLSKPEKDPKEIALAKAVSTNNYPSCLLCKENVGYKGRINHPARANHRTIKLVINNRLWHLQYSPYIYYNEHCILFSNEHIPMKISKNTFVNMLNFVDNFKHYFIGSNADLPIVGGSILTHDHYQGGNYHFPIEEAKVIKEYKLSDFNLSILKWPLSTIRLKANNKDVLINYAFKIYQLWNNYNDESVGIISYTNENHNTITPIARYKDNLFEVDLVLRNNRTDEEHPDGIFHAHKDVHNIKKENLGLIEVMGLAILPGRLAKELDLIKKVIENGENYNDYYELNKHYNLIERIKSKLGSKDLDQLIKDETANVFLKGLKDAGVYKDDIKGLEAFIRFVEFVLRNI